MDASPRIFVSYAHEGTEHRLAVKELAEWLRAKGVVVITDHPFENRALGNPDEARKLYEQVIELYQKEQAGLGLANVWQSVGDLERENGEFKKALDIYLKAIGLDPEELQQQKK